jgi:hypothetical protein
VHLPGSPICGLSDDRARATASPGTRANPVLPADVSHSHVETGVSAGIRHYDCWNRYRQSLRSTGSTNSPEHVSCGARRCCLDLPAQTIPFDQTSPALVTVEPIADRFAARQGAVIISVGNGPVPRLAPQFSGALAGLPRRPIQFRPPSPGPSPTVACSSYLVVTQQEKRGSDATAIHTTRLGRTTATRL